jgi:subtilisin family serine protease
VGATIGVARNPRLTLISYKVMNGMGYGTFESVVEGLDYAANRAKDGKRRVGE